MNGAITSSIIFHVRPSQTQPPNSASLFPGYKSTRRDCKLIGCNSCSCHRPANALKTGDVAEFLRTDSRSSGAWRDSGNRLICQKDYRSGVSIRLSKASGCLSEEAVEILAISNSITEGKNEMRAPIPNPRIPRRGQVHTRLPSSPPPPSRG